MYLQQDQLHCLTIPPNLPGKDQKELPVSKVYQHEISVYINNIYYT